MIAVLASIADEAALSFARSFPGSRASVLTCLDIARDSSCFCYPDFEASTITVGGKRVRIAEIDGVVNLLPTVFPEELIFYPQEECIYQAAEFTALLTFFLSALSCPVINRPTTLNLNGPVLNPIGWHLLAHAANIPTVALSIESDKPIDDFEK